MQWKEKEKNIWNTLPLGEGFITGTKEPDNATPQLQHENGNIP